MAGTGFVIVIIILLGIISPIVLEDKEENWESILNEKIERIETVIENDLSAKQTRIVNALSIYKDSLRVNLKRYLPFKTLSSSKSLPGKYLLAVIDTSNNLIEWDYSSLINQSYFIDEYFRPGETYFISNSLVDYLSVYDTINTESNQYYVALFDPLEKNYKIENRYFAPLNITDEYNKRFNTEFEFNFFKEALPSRDGRKHSFPMLNNNNNKIGVVTFLKPLRESELQSVANDFETLQSILTLVLALIIGLLVIKYASLIKYNTGRFFVYAVYITALRFIISQLNITELFSEYEIANSKYFSSLFGYGIANSPLELFLSVIALSVIIGLAFKYALEYYSHNHNRKNQSLLRFIIFLISFSFLYLMSIRGLGATVKSFVLDSSLRYYRESSLIPSSIELFMLFNLLVLGLIFFTGMLAYLIIVFANVPAKFKWVNVFFSFFLFLQISGVIFDLVQSEPQGTPFFRILFIFLSFVTLYFIVINGKSRAKDLFAYSFASSILVILLLTQYNSLVERESLRKTAYNLTRQNEDLLKFAVTETLVNAITDRETVQSFYFDNKNASSVAFKLWSNSILQKESLGSSITLIDSEHYKIGSFDFRFSNEFDINWDAYSVELTDLHEIKVFEEEILYSDNKIIRGIASIEDVEGVLGYITVSVIYDLSSLGLLNAPEFMVSDAGYINDTIDYTKLKIFDFHQGTLINSISNYNLGELEILAILDADFNEYGEAWVKIDVNDEDHLVFVLKRDQDDISRVLAIALKEKELSWGLFDFFKIFFVHMLIIIAALLVYMIFIFSKVRYIKFSFAAKLFISFIIISLIPLMLVSFFFRSVTTDKNEYAIEYKLGKRAESVEDYINDYIQYSSLNLRSISEKATRDLGIDFTLYRGNDFIYSSNGQYYEVGLIPKILNPQAYQRIFTQGLTETLVKEEIENYNFNSLYYKTSLLGEYHVIKITDAFNNIMLPLSGQEVDVYIFVSYSVALIIILILGLILTNQISKPIEKLKNATRSVAGGDLNVEVKTHSKDEVGELVRGFNYMVRELKRSQTELAEFERETAWKEMAKQVAHEIKNPLTPMKLSVQQLTTAYNDKSPKFEQLFERVSKTLINQIETLKNIASEFSSFARMPSPKLEILSLKELVNDAANLFSDEKVTFEIQGDDHKVEADKDQLRRVFINLIRNSIQASSSRMIIDLQKKENFVIINFTDNGTGISPGDAVKIFEVDFSTKITGMGIGLSMAKKTIENIGGEILLVNSNQTGTTFQIKLPVV